MAILLSFEAGQAEAIDVLKGLLRLEKEYDFSVVPQGGTEIVLIHTAESCLGVSCHGGKASLRFDFSRRILFFRAFSLLLEHLQDGETDFELQETVYFDLNGPMFDMSQGYAAMTVDALKAFLRQMAMMGLNMCIIYSEDTIAVPEEPYMGYMRAKYTYDELRELDGYADDFGIEMIPAIQTLAHLEEVLKWDVYRDLREDWDCMVPEDEKVYTFIRHVVKAASAPFRSRRIHIGMDEALDLGRGTYLNRNGFVPRGTVIRRHLKRVLEIVIDEMGLTPMVNSDMFGGSHNDADRPVDPAEKLPGVTFCYWDYYTYDLEHFRSRLRWHRNLGDVIFAGGIWTWIGFGPDWTKTFATMTPGLQACREEGIRQVMATVWGDSGTEADMRLTLLGLQFFAENGYRSQVSAEHVRKRFRFCTKGDYDDMLALQYIDETPGVEAGNPRGRNPSKYLLWQDPLCGLHDANIRGLALNEHYAKLEGRIAEAIRNDPFRDIFELYRRLCHVLRLKSELGLQIRDAYLAGDKAALRLIAENTIPEIIRRTEALHEQHYHCWMQMYKALGWEIFDLRYGGLLIRLETAGKRLLAYVNGETERLEELEEPRLPYNGNEGVIRNNYYGRIVSAGRIAPPVFLKRPPV